MSTREYLFRFALMVRPFWKRILIVLAGQWFQQFVGLIFPYMTGLVFDALTHQRPTQAFQIVRAYIIMNQMERLIGWRRNKYELPLHFHVEAHLEAITLSRIRMFSVGQFKTRNSAEIMDIVRKGQGAIWNALKALLFELFPQVVKVVVGLSMLTYLDWRLGIPFIITFAGFYFYMRAKNEKFRPRMRGLTKKEGELEKHSTELVHNMPLVVTSGKSEELVAEFKTHRDTTDERGIAMWDDYMIELNQPRSYVVSWVADAVRYFAVTLVAAKQLPLGMLYPAYRWVDNITDNIGYFQQAERNFLIWKAQASRHFTLIDTPPAVSMAPNALRFTLSGEIRLVDLGFIYPDVPEEEKEDEEAKGVATAITGPELPEEDERRVALENINLLIKAGQRVAFVGPSGAGKTTIIGLILRMYDPTKGAIFVDGHNLTTIDLQWWYSKIGYVEQDTRLFDESIKYNIALGRTLSDEKLEEVLELAQLSDLRSRLKNGWNTVVGERGVRLSGGERQRLAIARAIAKDPEIVVLDEATSSLDTESERLIQKALDAVCKGRTTMMVAHRLSTVVHSDKIVVVDGGRIVAQGTHNELQDSSPLYQKLVRNQMLATNDLMPAAQLN